MPGTPTACLFIMLAMIRWIVAAVVRRDIGEPVGGIDAAGARHVARHERRIAGNETAHVARQKPRAEIVVVAGRGADDQADLLALVEIGDGVGARGQAGGERQCRERAQAVVTGSRPIICVPPFLDVLLATVVVLSSGACMI